MKSHLREGQPACERGPLGTHITRQAGTDPDHPGNEYDPDNRHPVLSELLDETGCIVVRIKQQQVGEKTHHE